MKNKTTAYLLWFISIFGLLGFHQFYLNKPVKGVLYFFTAGLFTIGAFLDLFTLGGQVDTYNTKQELKQLRATTNALAASSLANQQR